MKISLLSTAILSTALVATTASAQANPSPTTPSSTSTATTSTTTTVAPDPLPVAPVTPATSSGTGSGATTEEMPTTETKSGINRPLLLTSFLLLGGTYLASAIDAAESGRPEDHKYLYYPVVGPWMDLAKRDCTSRPCGGETGNKALLILDGVGQGLGAIGMITSLFIPEKTTRHWILLGHSDVQAGPTLVGTGYGLGAVGRF